MTTVNVSDISQSQFDMIMARLTQLENQLSKPTRKGKAGVSALDKAALISWDVPEIAAKSVKAACAAKALWANKDAQGVDTPEELADLITQVQDGKASAAILSVTYKVTNSKGQDRGMGTLMLDKAGKAGVFVSGGVAGGVTCWAVPVTNGKPAVFILKHKGQTVAIRAIK